MISSAPGYHLKKAFLDTYRHFADKRIKNVHRGTRFVIDDRGPNDVGADGALYGWFCQIFVDVEDDDRLAITFAGNVPRSRAVATWFESNGAETSNFGITAKIVRGEQSKLVTLATAFEAIVAPKAHYPIPSYKYVCPRVAAALRKLKSTLDRAWPI